MSGKRTAKQQEAADKYRHKTKVARVRPVRHAPTSWWLTASPESFTSAADTHLTRMSDSDLSAHTLRVRE